MAENVAQCVVHGCNSRAVVTLKVEVIGYKRDNSFDYCGIHIGEYHQKFKESPIFHAEVRDIEL